MDHPEGLAEARSRRRMRAARLVAWLALLSAAGALVGAEARPTGLPDGVVAYRDIAYRQADGRRLRLDVYRPDGPAPAGGWPAVLAIHGGGWFGGSKDRFGRLAARLAEYGHVVVAAEYRLSRPGSPAWPGNLEDVRAAVRWMRRHAPDYGIDPARIAAMGASAGGHLAALLGTYPDGPAVAEGRPRPPAASGAASARVGAVIDLYGPSDLAALRTEATGPMALLLGGPPGRFPGRYEAASPVAHASAGDAPMLLIQGGDDRTVPRDQAERLARALATAGVPHRLIVLDGAGHGFGFVINGRDLLPEILAFLEDSWNHEVGIAPRDPPAPRPAAPSATRGEAREAHLRRARATDGTGKGA